MQRTRIATTSMRWYEPCNANRPAALISLEPFKPLSPETIKAQRANRADAAAMCQSEHKNFIAVQQG
jgi:hypothetical protein